MNEDIELDTKELRLLIEKAFLAGINIKSDNLLMEADDIVSSLINEHVYRKRKKIYDK